MRATRCRKDRCRGVVGRDVVARVRGAHRAIWPRRGSGTGLRRLYVHRLGLARKRGKGWVGCAGRGGVDRAGGRGRRLARERVVAVRMVGTSSSSFSCCAGARKGPGRWLGGGEGMGREEQGRGMGRGREGGGRLESRLRRDRAGRRREAGVLEGGGGRGTAAEGGGGGRAAERRVAIRRLAVRRLAVGKRRRGAGVGALRRGALVAQLVQGGEVHHVQRQVVRAGLWWRHGGLGLRQGGLRRLRGGRRRRRRRRRRRGGARPAVRADVRRDVHKVLTARWRIRQSGK